MIKFTVLIVLSYVCVSIGKDFSNLNKDVLQDIFDIYNLKPPSTRDTHIEIVDPDKIKYYLFTNNNAQNFTIINSSNATGLNKDAPVLFLIHGWTQSRDASWYELFTKTFFELNAQYNIIQVDYSPYSKIGYVAATIAATDVGHTIGEFVVTLIRKYLIPINNILLIGHSLGGQITSFVGQKVQEVLGKKLPRIIALDPAGPIFQQRPENQKLNKNAATVVEVIHTNGGVFGYLGSCGTIDFFPNGGSIQPGCTQMVIKDITQISNAVFCPHTRSTKLLASALKNKNHFEAKECSRWVTYTITPKLCPNNSVHLGDIETDKTGNYYLNTTGTSPYYKN